MELLVSQPYSLQRSCEYNVVVEFRTELDFPIPRQPNKFVRLNGIEYIVLIGENEKDSVYNGGETDCYLFRVYLIPKDPAMKDAPVKEFQVHFPFEDEIMSTSLRKLLGTNAEKYERFVCFKDDVHNCFIHDTKLYFSVNVRGIPPYREDEYGNELGPPYDALGTLIGAYWTVDLTKLENIRNRNVEYRKLITEQVYAYEFVNTGELHFTEKVYLRETDNNMGLICLFGKKEDSSMGLLYKWNISDGSKPQLINFPCRSDDCEWAYRITLHTHGALLIFAFHIKELFVYFFTKCLKTNLLSLAFNRAFFHKNTPLRYHPAYRLCYGRMKPLKYKEQFSDGIPENMED